MLWLWRLAIVLVFLLKHHPSFNRISNIALYLLIKRNTNHRFLNGYLLLSIQKQSLLRVDINNRVLVTSTSNFRFHSYNCMLLWWCLFAAVATVNSTCLHSSRLGSWFETTHHSCQSSIVTIPSHEWRHALRCSRRQSNKLQFSISCTLSC